MTKSALRVLAPSDWRGDLGEFLGSARQGARSPFAAVRVEAVEHLSREILTHPRLRADPAGVALGFWLRAAHIAELRADYERRGQFAGLRVAAGLVVHFAPANVDTMFVFSWALSFLVGNANVVRLTTRSSPVMEDLIECLNRVFAARPAPCEGNLFVTYAHDDQTTGRLSEACDTRIIWGGDETVRRIRAIPLNPHASERAFASKRSVSVFASAAYADADDAARADLAGRMAGDLAPFMQLACSSPHVVHWLGTRDDAMASSADFATRLELAMVARLGDPDLGWASRRIEHAFVAAAEGRAASMTHFPITTAVHAFGAESAEAEELCGGGFLVHVNGGSLDGFGECLRTNHQTVTYFGLDSADLHRLAILAGKAGVDRIVQVGRALDFGPQWDGFDLWADLSRILVLQQPNGSGVRDSGSVSEGSTGGRSGLGGASYSRAAPIAQDKPA